ncbi:hypothetical protein NRS6120_16215 [Bacillus subtilis]|nr:hypothetical protein NRS6120_01560 [Bacillus subtilis]CAI6301092.1 hypothetical protein NRS6120_16215 [Bacillus subtilis]
MEETTVFINFETLDLARVYLFGGVKYLDLMLVLNIIDILTGVVKAWKFKELRSPYDNHSEKESCIRSEIRLEMP